MPKKPDAKMSIEDRAKQFAPFSALKGLDEALEQKEREVESRLKAKHHVVKEE